MKAGSKLTTFLDGGGKAFFAEGVSPLAGKIAKAAAVLSIAGAMAMTFPAEQAQARGGGMAIGLVSGMMLGAAMSSVRIVPAQPVYQQAPVYYAPQPQPVYQQAPVQYQQAPIQYQQPVGGRPGTYYCPQGPTRQCFWKHGEIDSVKDLDLAQAAPAAEPESPAPRMGG